MSPAKTVAPKPKPRQVPTHGPTLLVDAVTFDQVLELERPLNDRSAPLKRPEPIRWQVSTLGLDFLERIYFRRTSDEQAAWSNPAVVCRLIYGASQVLKAQRYLADDDYEAHEFLAEMLEYLAVRGEVAAESDHDRLMRWRVRLPREYQLVDAKPAKAKKAVA